MPQFPEILASTSLNQPNRYRKGISIMKLKTALIVLSLASASAFASDPHTLSKTREQVRAELIQAQRSGDMLAAGESSLTLREQNPGQYPAAEVAASKTRAQVTAELAEAIHTGDVMASGDFGAKLKELAPQRYPAQAIALSKSREQVKLELAHAIHDGEMVAHGEDGRTLNEIFPDRYEAHHSHASASPVDPAPQF
jgi:hypothetical protein